jgi:hypothetical protein
MVANRFFPPLSPVGKPNRFHRSLMNCCVAPVLATGCWWNAQQQRSEIAVGRSDLELDFRLLNYDA